ncbi:hypothetical protein H6P81_016161 [Aristolochia fimbriata]|uniref:Integrase catalytic domain-containing protein n=1 Tax=Aristolochia fimbriata TaxID=158543 RepID=A0AAV7EAE9_ARIFI|nr:hypothetical protein H6P81_016161 [Aristolochia fimbriata]
MGFVDGSIQPPPQFSTADSSTVTPEYIQWYALDQTIQSWIVATLSNAVIGQTIGLTSASAMWHKLQRVYASTSEGRLNHLRFTLQTLRKGPSLNVAARGHCGGGRVGRGRHSRGRGQNSGRGFERNQQDQSDSSNRPLCQICNKRGHTAIQCHNRFNLSYQPSAPPEAHSAQLDNSSDSVWYIDYGASHHISSDASLLTDSGSYNGPDQVMLSNRSGLPISAIGTLNLTPSLPLQGVLSVPSSLKNLLSVSKLTSDHNCQVILDSNGFRGRSRNDLYVIDHNASPSCLLSSVSDFSFWHRRLGHPGASVMCHVFRNHNIVVSDSTNNTCHACRIIKSTTLPFTSSQTRAPSKLHTILADIWGPCPITSINGYRYYISFIRVENQFLAKIKVFQSDGGTEFMSKKFQALPSTSGIHHNVSCPYTPQQNSLVERKHRHIVKMGMTLLAQASMPKSHWDSAFATSVYIINRLPTPILHSKCSFDVLDGKQPDYSLLRVFGCLCYPHLRSYSAHKLEDRSTACIFLGYHPNYKGYKCLDVTRNKLYVSRNAVFDETIFPYSQPALLLTPKPSSSSTAPLIPLLPLPPIVPSPVSSTVPIAAIPNVTHTGRWAIGRKWIFRVKTNPDGSIDRYKARLVAKGFNQREGQDYFETFSPVVKPVTIRTVLTLAVGRNWSIRQLDVNNAFLNSNLDEETHPDTFCRLHKSLYELKQSPRAWYQRLTSYLIDLGFALSKVDSSLLVRYTSTATIFVLIYINDIIIIGSSAKDIACLVANLQREFSIKDLGALYYFLGIEVTSLQSGLHLAQTKLTTHILSRLGLSEVKPLYTPIVTGSKLSKYEGTPLYDPSLYRGTVGALQFLILTRPDIQYAINQACQFQQNPTNIHWSTVKRILRFLKGTLRYGLVIHPSSNLGVDIYSDADWDGCPVDRRSITGFCIFLCGSLISWSSKKQPMVARSSAEAEYRALTIAAAEATWVLQLFKELKVFVSNPPIIWCDNLSATYIAANPVFHGRVKHVELDYHFIRERVTSGLLQVKYISTHDQVADVFTKGLSKSQFVKFLSKLHVFSKPLSLSGNVRHHV